MPEETIEVDSNDIDYSTVAMVARRELRSNVGYRVDERPSSSGNAMTLLASMHSVRVEDMGSSIRVTMDAPQGAIDAIKGAIRAQSDVSWDQHNANDIEEVEQAKKTMGETDNELGVGTGTDMGGARAAEMLPNDAELQATMRLYDNGLLMVQRGDSNSLYETAAGFFLLSGMSADGDALEIAEGYTIEDFGAKHGRNDIKRALREVEKALKDK